MAKHTSDNLHIKRNYLVWLRDAKGLSEASLDKAAAAVDRWLDFIKGADLRKFHSEKAVAFKRRMERETSALGRPLSDASREAILRDLKAFFLWLADQPGYRSKIRHVDAQWFTPDRRIARSSHQGLWRPHPSPEQVERAIDGMPDGSVFERRNRALLGLIYLTGSRVTAAMTLRLRHIDLEGRCLHFDGKDVHTKFGKRFTVFYFPVGERFEFILGDWIAELRQERLFGAGDPVFPKTQMGLSVSGSFEPIGLLRQPWSGSGKIAEVVKSAFVEAGLPPFSPHRIRNTLVDLAQVHCKTPEDFKAWSQNLGHDDVLTTFQNYGSVATGRQKDIMERFRSGALIEL